MTCNLFRYDITQVEETAYNTQTVLCWVTVHYVPAVKRQLAAAVGL